MPITFVEPQKMVTAPFQYPDSQKILLYLESTDPVDVFVVHSKDTEKLLADLNNYPQFFATKFSAVNYLKQVIPMSPAWLTSSVFALTPKQCNLLIFNQDEKKLLAVYYSIQKA